MLSLFFSELRCIQSPRGLHRNVVRISRFLVGGSMGTGVFNHFGAEKKRRCSRCSAFCPPSPSFLNNGTRVGRPIEPFLACWDGGIPAGDARRRFPARVHLTVPNALFASRASFEWTDDSRWGSPYAGLDKVCPQMLPEAPRGFCTCRTRLRNLRVHDVAGCLIYFAVANLSF